MRDLTQLFTALAKSPFRRKFRLSTRESTYLRSKGLAQILTHASDLIRQRLAPAKPLNDGKQTPLRNHPVFVAQHATATCCRGCLEKWHHIQRERELSDQEQQYVVQVIEHWLLMQVPDLALCGVVTEQPTLFEQ